MRFEKLKKNDFVWFVDALNVSFPEVENKLQLFTDVHNKVRSFFRLSHLKFWQQYFNISSSEKGDKYDLELEPFITLPFGYGAYLTIPSMLFLDLANINLTLSVGDATYAIQDITNLCQDIADGIDISNIGIGCGMVMYIFHLANTNERTAPNRTDGGDPEVLSSYATWSQHMYMCATAANAKVAITAFTYNGTGGLANLRLDKQYRNYSESAELPPVWAVEDLKMNVSDINPIWGIVDDEYLDSPGLQTLRSDHFYLPASESVLIGNISDTVASAVIPGAVLLSMYGINLDLPSPDYSGGGNQAILKKWVGAGETLRGVEGMINLVFVDMMSQMIVGSKSLLDVQKSATNAIGTSEVRILSSQIQYDLRYAIPISLSMKNFLWQGLIMLTIWVSVLLGAAVMNIAKKVTLATIRQLLNQSMFLPSGCVFINSCDRSCHH